MWTVLSSMTYNSCLLWEFWKIKYKEFTIVICKPTGDFTFPCISLHKYICIAHQNRDNIIHLIFVDYFLYWIYLIKLLNVLVLCISLFFLCYIRHFLIFLFFYICSGFCHTLKWNSHGFTCVPHPDPPSHLPLHRIPLGPPSAPGPSACPMHPYLGWWSVSP